MIASLWPSINSLADHWAGYMVTALLDATIGLALVSCIYLAVRRRVSPRWCYLLFLLVPLKLLLPIPLPLLPATAMTTGPATSVTDNATLNANAVPPYAAPLVRELTELGESDRATTADESTPAETVATSVQDGVGASPSITTLLMSLWASIALALGYRFGRNQVRMTRLLAEASRISPSTYGVNFEALKGRLGIRREIPVVASDQINVPAVAGLLSPRIVLPTSLLRLLDGRQLECILAHELAHLKWRDVPVALLERLVRIVHFMNPALWLAGHLAHRYRENACDDASLIAMDMDHRTCGATLLQVLKFAHDQQRAMAPAIALFQRTQYHQRRLRRIMTTQTTAGRASTWNILLLLAVTIIVLPNLRAAPPKSSTDELPSAVGAPRAESSEKRTQKDNEKPVQEPVNVVEEGPLVEKVYDITTLLQLGTDPDRLIELITGSVLLSSWDNVGGDGSVSIDTETSQLHVRNVASVQQAIERLLETFEAILNEKKKRGPNAPLPKPRSVDLLVHFNGAIFEQIVRIYVIPSLLFADPSRRDPRLADYDALVRLTTSAIDPNTWDEVGGPGSISTWPAGDSLVVAQSRETQAKILKLFSLLSGLAGVNSGQNLKSAEPIDVGFSIGSPFPNHVIDDLETKLYPVHDLLPHETKPVFRMSPRAIALSQFGDWLVKKGSPNVDAPICIEAFRTKGTILLAATPVTHQRLGSELSALRRRMQQATTPQQRSALSSELFPGLFRERSGFYPGGSLSAQIYLYGTRDTDQQLAQFARSADEIVQVHLIAGDVTDKGLATLGSLDRLSNLTIWSTHITDTGVSHLAKIPFLSSLSLHAKQITNAAAESIAAMDKLVNLNISGTSISDEGLKTIIANRRWMMVDVNHATVSPATVESLHQSHPHIHIRLEQ